MKHTTINGVTVCKVCWMPIDRKGRKWVHRPGFTFWTDAYPKHTAKPFYKENTANIGAA